MIASTVSEKIELFISCRNLKDMDVFSKSDPYVKVSFRKDFTYKQYLPIGKTETINNNLNPNFAKSFMIDYIFQSKQDIKFEVFDDDGGNDDYIGEVETTVGALMGAKCQTSILDLKFKGENRGKIVIRCEKCQDSNQYYMMKLRAVKLMNTDSFFDFWDKSDPYLKFLKIRQDNSFVQACRTEVVQNNLNPNWKPIQIKCSRLFNESLPKFKIECWDWEQDGKDQFIGECFLSKNDISTASFPMQIILKNPKHNKPGTLVLEGCQFIQKPSFLDYLRGGLELNMMVAIDFTGSNGMPTSPTSLHYMSTNSLNQYQMAIAAVSQILLNYDSDKRIAAFGFGAQTRFNGTLLPVSHCFALSGDPNQIEACGVEHLMSLYQRALLNVNLSGPTYFKPIIQQTMKLSYMCRNQGSKVYQTLLILTDGQIHDMQATVDLLVEASSLPLSIIIVGVGNADFSNMNTLDGDNGLYNSQGVKAKRDIVQFVPFREVGLNMDFLAKELLAELPDQIVQYMALIGKAPGKVEPINIDKLIGVKSPNNEENMPSAEDLIVKFDQ